MLFLTESEFRRQKELLHFLQQLSDEPLHILMPINRQATLFFKYLTVISVITTISRTKHTR